jgi:hypothetical protein
MIQIGGTRFSNSTLIERSNAPTDHTIFVTMQHYEHCKKMLFVFPLDCRARRVPSQSMYKRSLPERKFVLINFQAKENVCVSKEKTIIELITRRTTGRNEHILSTGARGGGGRRRKNRLKHKIKRKFMRQL